MLSHASFVLCLLFVWFASTKFKPKFKLVRKSSRDDTLPNSISFRTSLGTSLLSRAFPVLGGGGRNERGDRLDLEDTRLSGTDVEIHASIAIRYILNKSKHTENDIDPGLPVVTHS